MGISIAPGGESSLSLAASRGDDSSCWTDNCLLTAAAILDPCISIATEPGLSPSCGFEGLSVIWGFRGRSLRRGFGGRSESWGFSVNGALWGGVHWGERGFRGSVNMGGGLLGVRVRAWGGGTRFVEEV